MKLLSKGKNNNEKELLCGNWKKKCLNALFTPYVLKNCDFDPL